MLLSKIESLIDADALMADSSEIMQNAVELPNGDYGAPFVKMFLTMISLVALFAISIWFLKRIIRSRLEKGSGEQMIRVLEKKMLSPKTMLYVIEHEGKKVLLAESKLEIKSLSRSNIIPFSED
jgi:flagellar biogenesis protein FliO